MTAGHFLQERGFGGADILDRLAGHGLGQEADEVAGMASRQRHADLAFLLHAADAGTVSGPRIDDNEGWLGGIGDVSAGGTMRTST